MRIERTHEHGPDQYTASRGGFQGTGASAYQAAYEAESRERRFRGDGTVTAARPRAPSYSGQDGNLIGGAMSALRYLCIPVLFNMVARPLPTLLIAGVGYALHWLALAILPDGWLWVWGAHLVFAVTTAGVIATDAKKMEASEGLFIEEWHDSPVAYMALYWACMAASMLASGYMAGLAFDWLAAHGLLRSDAYADFRFTVQYAVGAMTLLWRSAWHPTLGAPCIPWFR